MVAFGLYLGFLISHGNCYLDGMLLPIMPPPEPYEVSSSLLLSPSLLLSLSLSLLLPFVVVVVVIVVLVVVVVFCSSCLTG